MELTNRFIPQFNKIESTLFSFKFPTKFTSWLKLSILATKPPVKYASLFYHRPTEILHRQFSKSEYKPFQCIHL